MKRQAIYVIGILALVLLCLPLVSQAEEDLTSQGLFILPEKLEIIEEGAFEDTAASWIILDGSVRSIGSRAFAHMDNLRAIALPKSIVSVAPDVFGGNANVILCGPAGSYAEKWAKEHGFHFERIDLWALLRSQQDQFRLQSVIRRYVLKSVSPDKVVRTRPGDVPDVSPYEKPEMPPLDYVFP